MSPLAALLVVLLTGAPPATDDPAFREQFSEAIRRHDGGDYAGAISIYRSMLKTWPHDPLVVYELSFSMSSGGTPPAELIAFIESELKVMKQPNPKMYSLLGAANDGLKKYPEAERAFRKGLELDPKNGDLEFNLAVNLSFQNKPVAAEEEFVKAVALAPDWPGIWRSLAVTLEQNGKPIDSIFARLNFLMLEPRGKRAEMSAAGIDKLFDMMVKRDGNKMNIQVASDADLPLQLILAATLTPEPHDSAQLVSAIEAMVTASLREKTTGARAASLKRLAAAKKANCLTAAIWQYRRLLGDPAAETWFSKHAEDEERLRAFREPREQ